MQNLGLKTKNWIQSIAPFLFTFFLGFFPVLYLFNQNRDRVNISEVFLPLVMFLSIGAVSFTLSFVAFRSKEKSALIAALFIIFFFTYRYFESIVRHIFPTVYYWHIVPVSIFIMLHIAWFVGRILPNDICKFISNFGTMMLAILIAINLSTSIPAVITKISEGKPNQDQVIYPENPADSDMPNIYLMIFDEYAGFYQLQDEFNYDNSAFERNLRNMGFAFSRNSHNEYYTTAITMGNIMSLDYIVHADMETSAILEKSSDSYLLQYMNQRGYIVRGIGNKSSFISSLTEDTSSSETALGDSFEKILLNNSPLYPFLATTKGQAKIVLETIEYIKDPNNVPQEPTFTFSYLSTPHSPHVFDEDGNVVEQDNVDYETYKGNYHQQLKYMSKEIAEISDAIVSNDPDSIVILVSDHGFRDWEKLTTSLVFQDAYTPGTKEYDNVTNILNAVYYRGDSLDEIGGQSVINTLRIVLNKLFNENMPMVEASDYEKANNK